MAAGGEATRPSRAVDVARKGGGELSHSGFAKHIFDFDFEIFESESKNLNFSVGFCFDLLALQGNIVSSVRGSVSSMLDRKAMYS